ncbi:MAG: 2Fe-2S iron-sulfur cluster-binding protein [Nitrospirota bacterium]|nr:2Fe-2S iron-sulfur cluster-binding protein [Nitrospirota bacterium]
MGGSNPYIEPIETQAATQPFSVTFKTPEENLVVQVDPSKIPYGPTGQPGSILDIAMGAGLDVEHACGGVCACSTCHVIVREGLDTCSEATDDELDQLDEAPAITLQSRLACQCVPDGTQNLVVEIPEWNKNLVKEGH